MSAADEIPNGTASGLFQFLDYLVDKGYAPGVSISPLRIATRKVFEAVDGKDYGNVPVVGLDTSEHVRRFEHLKGHEYKRESLTAYRQRFDKAVTMYQDYLREGSAWKAPSFRGPGRRTVRPASSAASNGSKATPVKSEEERGSTQTQTPIPATPTTLLDYPFPLIDGGLAHLRLPRALSARDAERIGAFVATLAVDSKTPDRAD